MSTLKLNPRDEKLYGKLVTAMAQKGGDATNTIHSNAIYIIERKNEALKNWYDEQSEQKRLAHNERVARNANSEKA
jgi:hypothetical protein